MHDAAYQFVQDQVRQRGVPYAVLEIGGKVVNGTIRRLFEGADSYTSIDIRPGPGVDVVADGATYQHGFAVDVVVCCEVLEHTDAAEAICRNAWKQLRPGGLFYVTAAGIERAPHSAEDGGPLRAGEFYHNVSVSELSDWLSDFASSQVLTNPAAGDIYAVAQKGPLS